MTRLHGFAWIAAGEILLAACNVDGAASPPPDARGERDGIVGAPDAGTADGGAVDDSRQEGRKGGADAGPETGPRSGDTAAAGSGGAADAGDAGPVVDAGPLPDAAPAPVEDAGLPDDAPVLDGGEGDEGDACDDVDCSSLDDACYRGVCNPATGACEAVAVGDGTSCDDGDACTTGDECTAGSCGGEALDCSGLDDACNTGVCDAATGSCVAAPRAEGTSCDDGDACTTGDECTAGSCGGAALDCSGLDDACNVGVCDASLGCVAAPRADGTSCDDGDACTTGDVCTGGVCGGSPLTRAGDTCDDPIALSGSDGVQVVAGGIDACDTNHGEALGCLYGSVGRDVVYQLELAAPRQTRFTTYDPGSGGYDTVIHVRRTCAEVASELACDDDSAGDLYSELHTELEAGTHYVYVDAYDAEVTGNYEMEVEVIEPDGCAQAAELAIPAPGETGTIVGDTSGASNAFGVTSTCADGAGSPDHVYAFTVTEPTTLRFETITFQGAYDTALHIRAAPCAEGAATTVYCDDDGGHEIRSRIEATFEAGMYYLVIDGYSTTSSGLYELQIENVL